MKAMENRERGSAGQDQGDAMKKGWETRTLDSCCEQIFAGGDVPKDRFSKERTAKFSVPIYSNGEKNDGLHGFTNLARVTKPSITVSARGTLGFTAIRTEPFLPVVRLIVLVPDEKQIMLSFLYYAVLGIDFENTGTSIPQLTVPNFKESKFHVPPLPEQQRIVGLLDEAFEGLATAKAKAEKNLQNARALFESHLQSVFTQRGKGWVETTLGAVAEVQSGGTPSVPEKAYWGGNIPWYSSGELNEIHTTDPQRTITDAGLNNSNAKLFPSGSLLIGMYDTAALKMSILDRDGAFNQAIAGVKPNEKVEVEFILHAINAVKPRLLLERRGVRQKNLSLGKIKEIAILIPPPTEQRAVLSSLRNVVTETQRLAQLYKRKLAALEALKKSLLHQAFTGAL